MRRKQKSAAELMAELQSNPDWARRNSEQETWQRLNAERRLKEIEPEHARLLAELANAGVMVRPHLATQLSLDPKPIPVRSISDLVNTRDSYPDAIPILIKHLENVQHPIMVASIARALTVKEACETIAPRIILDRLKQTKLCSDERGDAYQARWALANALTVVGNKKMVNEIKALIVNPNFADVNERLKDVLKHCERLVRQK